MRRTRAFLILLFLFAWLLTSCGLFRTQDEPDVDLTEIFPEDLPTIGQAQRLNVDGAGIKEWLVFYHIDLVDGNPDGSPTAAAVYRPVLQRDGRVPPHLIPALIWLPDQGYVCLYTCEADMLDAISGDPAGEELVIWDKRGDDTVGVAIFRWQADLETAGEREGEKPTKGGFVPLGHFRGDSIEVVRDSVKVIRKHRDRSDLAAQEIYTPQFGRYYREQVRHVDDPVVQLLSPQEAEIVFTPGPPENPAQVKLPEKLVLAFYQNFRDLGKIQGYFTEAAWGTIGNRCPANDCGCTSRYEDVSRVMVKQLAYESNLNKTTKVVAQVICIGKGNKPDPIGTVTWQLQQQPESSWRLFAVTPGGEGFLCPRTGCPPLGGGL
jgi:hypothetical protein